MLCLVVLLGLRMAAQHIAIVIQDCLNLKLCLCGLMTQQENKILRRLMLLPLVAIVPIRRQRSLVGVSSCSIRSLVTVGCQFAKLWFGLGSHLPLASRYTGAMAIAQW